MELRKGIRQIFNDEMLLVFWTHEKCPPNQQTEKGCQFDTNIKHDRCMPCWEDWIEHALIDPILALIKEEGYVKLSDDQTLPENPKARARLGSVDYHEYNGSFVNTYTVYKQAQQDMLKAGFRRVEIDLHSPLSCAFT